MELRSFKNILAYFIIIIGMFIISTYISGAMFVFIGWGVDYFDPRAIKPNFSNIPSSLWPTIFDYVENFIQYPENYDKGLKGKLFTSFLAPNFLLFIIFWTIRERLLDWRPFKKKESIHGDAKWADEKDIRKAGLRSKTGLLLGKDNRGFLIAPGFQHCLLFAPTGSGKGVGFVIPNLLFWEDSVVVHDIKLENYELTSGWRAKQGQQVYCWSPADSSGKSHCYNPLDWISEKPGKMVDDVQKIGSLLMPEQDFWVNEARSLFLGVVLYLIAVPDKIQSFGEVVRTMRSDDVTYNLAVALDTFGEKIHPVGYMNIAAFLQKAEKERSGVISTMNSSLELWANPLIDTTTSTSDFNFHDLKKKKITIYVGLTPDNLKRLRPLMQVFYQQAVEFLCEHMPRPDEKHGVLFLMDEFPTLGKMEQFQSGIAYFRGYRVRLFLIIQDTEQLKGIYEDSGMNSFLSNSTYRITFAANNIETATLISKLLGNKTVIQESLNKPKFMDFNPSARSVHVSETQRPLMLEQEIIGMDKDMQLLFIEATPPIMSKKIKYFSDRLFKSRLLPETFVPIQEPFDPKKYAEEKKKVAEENTIEDDNTQDNQSDEAEDSENDDEVRALIEDVSNDNDMQNQEDNIDNDSEDEYISDDDADDLLNYDDSDDLTNLNEEEDKK